MINNLKKEQCSGCHACYNICPKSCIKMYSDSEGFLYPEIDYGICIDCGLCKKVCPAYNEYKGNPKGEAYACVNKDDDIRLSSSSGGIFTLLAENILNKNGVVFGAAFDVNFNVGHICVTSCDELSALRGSKYVQSTVCDAFSKAKKILDDGRPVLFTGTPCQISGLKTYLGRDYDNLISQDIICHGSPSPKIWQKYLDYCKKGTSEVDSVCFRDKAKGWNNYSVLIRFSNGSERTNVFSKDLYMKAFLSNLSLRPSCYNCKSKSVERESDITLADFWGVKSIAPEIFDDKGTSLVLINSPKGKRIFEEIKNDIKYMNADFDSAVKYNTSVSVSAKMPKNRNKFFENADKTDFSKLVKRYLPEKGKLVVNSIKIFVKKMLNGCLRNR